MMMNRSKSIKYEPRMAVVSAKVPFRLFERIEEYRGSRGHLTRTETLIELLSTGLRVLGFPVAREPGLEDGPMALEEPTSTDQDGEAEE